MAEVKYINQEGIHNKFWSYDVDGNKVTYRWGRVGLKGQSKTKEYSSNQAAMSDVWKLVSQKEKKGYRVVEEEELKREVRVAQKLGVQFKIQDLKWVHRNSNKLTEIDEYDPNKWVYVEIVNSWKKDVTRLLLGKRESYRLGAGIMKGSFREMHIGEIAPVSDFSFANAVRSYLNELAAEVFEIVDRTVKIAAGGVRRLSLGCGSKSKVTLTKSETDNVVKQVASTRSSVNTKVLRKFAALGARRLTL